MHPHPRAWLAFADPADPDHEVRVDTTWLRSRWTCVYGRGCRGVVAGRPDDGCCSHGAFFSGREDEQRVRQAAARLTPDDWQHAATGRRRGLTERDEAHGEQRRRTRVVDGACVFLNQPGFAGGEGCALHALALREGRSIVETKPDVCWQLPLAVDREEVDAVDGRRLRVTAVTEWDRGRWGPGGADLHWWCTQSPLAHVGAEPVWRSLSAELTAVLGAPAYAELCRLLALADAGADPAPQPTDGR